jgi:flavin reductase (DIM6/NTAB) family NADH-FMN oxidoreductase RutF
VEKLNTAIVSSVVHLGANPALIGYVSRPNTVERHTVENIKETKFYTINHIHESFIKQAHQTSARYGKDVSEFDAVGLSAEFIDNFHAPFVLSQK